MWPQQLPDVGLVLVRVSPAQLAALRNVGEHGLDEGDYRLHRLLLLHKNGRAPELHGGSQGRRLQDDPGREPQIPLEHSEEVLHQLRDLLQPVLRADQTLVPDATELVEELREHRHNLWVLGVGVRQNLRNVEVGRVLLLLEGGDQGAGHIRHVRLEEVRHAAHGVLQQTAALLDQLGIARVLCQALPDHGPEGVADQRPYAHRLRGAFPDVHLPDDGGESVQDLAQHVRPLPLRVQASHQRRHKLLQAVPEVVVLVQARHHGANAVHDEEVHSDRQGNRPYIELSELRHQVLQVDLAAHADVLEGHGCRLLHLLRALLDLRRAAGRSLRHQQLRNHLQGGPQEVRPRLHPLPQVAQQLDGRLLRVVQQCPFQSIRWRRGRDQWRQALDQLPQHAAVPHLRPRGHHHQHEKVRLLDDDPTLLPTEQALQHMLQGGVGREHLQAILHQAEDALPVRGHLIIRKEGILGGAQHTPPNGGTKQLRVDPLKLVNLHVRLRMPTDLVGEAMPELQRDRADLLMGQVCASQDHLQDVDDLRVGALGHYQGHQAFAHFHVDSADLQQPILVAVQCRLHPTAQLRLELGPQAIQLAQDHLDHRLVLRDVHAAHAQDLHDDVRGGLAEIAGLHHMLETLGEEGVLRNV
mmetsp:Transcript_66279/g.158136  ORF Transcript_66279/g.158136 Transcript_66279/m.158136 type:complete len:639 (-) Transcript_66279:634-2550(-)